MSNTAISWRIHDPGNTAYTRQTAEALNYWKSFCSCRAKAKCSHYWPPRKLLDRFLLDAALASMKYACQLIFIHTASAERPTRCMVFTLMHKRFCCFIVVVVFQLLFYLNLNVCKLYVYLLTAIFLAKLIILSCFYVDSAFMEIKFEEVVVMDWGRHII